jgi:hypothetical protein
MRTDPPLIGPDPEWKFLLSGKDHVFYALAGIAVLAIFIAPKAPRAAALTVGLALGCIADLWAHEYGH